MKACKRDLVGRRIIAVDFHRFSSGREGARRDAAGPVITLDNGRRIWFQTTETEVGRYGTDIYISEPEKSCNPL